MHRGAIVGRQAELVLLTEALDDARAGRGGVVLLVGEPGIGKSRLSEEVARIAAADMDVVWGRAWEAGGAPPYWPWTQVLRGVGGTSTSPHVARLRGESADAPPATAEDRFLLFDAVTRHLIAVAGARPLVVILEDLHAADESSLHLLALLAGQLHNAPLLVLGTYRDVEARLTAAAGSVLDRVARTARVIHPCRLEHEHVIAIATADPTLTLDREALAAVHRRSEGNPLFVIELLRVIARRGVQGTVPVSVRTAIREHLRGLPPQLPPVLDAAAVIGREFAAGVVAEVCKRPLDEVSDALTTAVDLGVLIERGPARYAFAHGLIAETLHDDLPAARRAELHLAVADALERDPVKSLTEIAHHLLDAGPEHADRAAEAALQAAERARGQLAFEPAAALIERVFAAGAASTAAMRFELMRLLSEVRLLGGLDATGKQAAREAAELARTLGAPELIARAALTYGVSYSFGSTDHVLVQLLEEALAALPPGDHPLRARMLARLAAALTPAPESAPPMRVARDAIDMARRLGDDRTRLDVIYAAISALIPFALPSERRLLSLETLELAERFEEPLIVLRCHHRLVFDHCELGDLIGADNHARAYDAQVQRLRLPRAKSATAMFRAMRAMLQGRFAEHAAAIAEARQFAADAGDSFFESTSMVGHSIIAARLIGDDEYYVRERKAVLMFARTDELTHVPELSAYVHARLGELEEARAIVARHPIADLICNHHLAQLGSLGAELTYLLHDREMAAPLYAWLSGEEPPFGALHIHGYAIDRCTAHSSMLLAATLGDLDAARRHYASGAKLLRSVDARPHEAWLQLDLALILIRSGDRGEEPRTLLTSARSINDALGMKIANRIEVAEAELGVAAPPVPRTDVVAAIQLRCEGEYWVVEGLGSTCRLKATKGIEFLARLVGEPGREIHVLDLMGAEVVDGGDAGEVLDARARTAYRARIIELRASLEEAEQWNDAVRAERARDELEALEAEVARAAGLGGRERRVGRAAERARINVQRRLADAIRRISDVDAELGKHLAATVRTGVYCSYAPERATRDSR